MIFLLKEYMLCYLVCSKLFDSVKIYNFVLIKIK